VSRTGNILSFFPALISLYSHPVERVFFRDTFLSCSHFFLKKQTKYATGPRSALCTVFTIFSLYALQVLFPFLSAIQPWARASAVQASFVDFSSPPADQPLSIQRWAVRAFGVLSSQLRGRTARFRFPPQVSMSLHFMFR